MTPSTHLLIARHGNTFAPGDVVRRVGTTDLPLVASGLQQGQKLGHYLQQTQKIPDVIFTSELKRTKQTAEQIIQVLGVDIPITALSLFNEIDYGPDENQPEEQVIARIGAESLRLWEMQAQVPDGWKVDPQETIKNWQKFANDLLLHYGEKTILVVTSNGIARFAPYLTGDFTHFSKQHGIKIATGALCVFKNTAPSSLWECSEWNVR